MTPVGPLIPHSRQLPKQSPERVLVLAERWQRASQAHNAWATKAKLCVDMVEGRQWTKEQIAKLAAMGRPSMQFNKINNLVRLVLGYHASNKTDLKYMPGNDTLSNDATADAITQVFKQISYSSQLPYVDTEVFMDGIMTGRGMYDQRISYDENDFGEVKIEASDAFRTYLDPDGEHYDISQGCSYIIDAPSLSLDEIEWKYGKDASEAIRPYLRGETPISPISLIPTAGETFPIRGFGAQEDDFTGWWDQLYSLLGDFVDPYRKTIRALDFQYWVTTQGRVFIDLETGDRAIIPKEMTDDQINKILWVANSAGNQLIVDFRPIKRVRWTTMVGDVFLYDDWSQQDHFTKKGFFPYFRRGTTRGMVEDLVDPQLEINKRRNASIENAARSGNVGWSVHTKSMTPKERAHLRKFGGMAGFVLEWSGPPELRPERLTPGPPAVQHEKEALKAQEDLREISGINESALGEQDNVTSGKAIIARQKQAVVAIELYFDNFRRTRGIIGRDGLVLMQRNYSEPRMYRIIGEDGKLAQVMINQEIMDPSSGMKRILNDVTLGKYQMVVDNRPISASFEAGQFEELIAIIKDLGQAIPLQLFGDLILEQSSLPNKDEWVKRYRQFMGMAGPAGAGAQPGMATGGGQPMLPPPGAGAQPSVAAE
jgi:hypothetical protein